MRASYSRWATFWSVVCSGIFGSCLTLMILVPDTPHTHHGRTLVLALSFVFSLFGALIFFVAAMQNDTEDDLKQRRLRAEKQLAKIVERETKLRSIA